MAIIFCKIFQILNLNWLESGTEHESKSRKEEGKEDINVYEAV